MMRAAQLGFVLLAALALNAPASAAVRGKPVHALALYGEPKFGPDFKNFDHVNPNAPQGGTLRLQAIGTFDSFNPFITKGNPAAGFPYLGGASLFIEGLMTEGADEPFTQYCLLCETVELAQDGSWMEFTMRANARFNDGTPVTADDVVFSFNTLMEKGQPLYKLYYGDIERVEKTGPLKARFHFKVKDNNELPLILGQLPVLSKAYWEKHDFTAGGLDVPVSTGPYKVASFEPGRFIVFKRDPNYWGRDMPFHRGSWNYEEVRYDYYRDDDVAFESFKAGGYDLQIEVNSARWSTGYDEKVLKNGIVKKEFRDGMPDNPQFFVFNLRREKFSDPRVRRALQLAFDFAWGNKNLSHGMFEQMVSYFQGSELASSGLPEGEELKILEKYRDKLPPELFTKPYEPVLTDGSGNNRENLLKARQLLTEAGWSAKGGALLNDKTGEKFEIEILSAQQGQEKWFAPYIQNLARLGVKAQFRVIDQTQYINRVTNFDFDMMLGGYGQSNSPGNEQREYYGSAAADRPGSRNYGGVKNPVVDAIIEELIRVPSRDSLVAHTRALDRVLLWNYYVVPQIANAADRYAMWDKFGIPGKTPLRGVSTDTWWIDPAKAQALEGKRASK